MFLVRGIKPMSIIHLIEILLCGVQDLQKWQSMGQELSN